MGVTSHVKQLKLAREQCLLNDRVIVELRPHGLSCPMGGFRNVESYRRKVAEGANRKGAISWR